jgi:hypothetical protein
VHEKQKTALLNVIKQARDCLDVVEQRAKNGEPIGASALRQFALAVAALQASTRFFQGFQESGMSRFVPRSKR